MLWQLLSRSPRWLSVVAAVWGFLWPVLAAEAARLKFDLPADVVARSIKIFAQQSGVEILISADLGREIRTQAVVGEFTPREALDRMLGRTTLVAKQDEKTGVITIMRAASAPGQAGARPPGVDAPSSAKKKRP